MSTKKTLLLEAQHEQAGILADHRVNVIRAINELLEFGGSDDYKPSALAIVKDSGDTGITVTKLRQVLPNPTELAKAVDTLVIEGAIEEQKDGRTTILRFKPGAANTIKQA